MKKLLTLFFGLGLLTQQALGSSLSDMSGTFSAYANSLVGSGGSLMTDTGNSGSGVNWVTDIPTISSYITDTSAETWILGTSTNAYVDLGFNTSVYNGAGADLKLFFVGDHAHNFTMTVFSGGTDYALPAFSLVPPTGDTGATTVAWGDGIYAMDVNLDSLSLGNNSITKIRLAIGNGYDINNSAVPAFVGAYHTVAPVPVPAAVWLFGSGLLGLVGLVRKRA